MVLKIMAPVSIKSVYTIRLPSGHQLTPLRLEVSLLKTRLWLPSALATAICTSPCPWLYAIHFPSGLQMGRQSVETEPVTRVSLPVSRFCSTIPASSAKAKTLPSGLRLAEGQGVTFWRSDPSRFMRKTAYSLSPSGLP
ncbi:hypothetical protein SDC9_148856 [bioreactor metagenome]|uniref:Uncharacterized protein n=1 Tax=bioreactor metagenome TaxID=1076179 RepID=A0A645EJL9_9ZZZZ